MPRRHPYAHCKECGKRREEEPGGILSARGLCLECGLERMRQNNTQMIERQGHYFDHYVRKTWMQARLLKHQLDEKAS